MLKHTPLNTDENIITTQSQLCDIFYSGFKSCDEKNVGVEFEKLPVDKKTYKAAPYGNVAKFLTEYKNGKWQSISEKGSILGLQNPDGTVTLEPGSQTELSLLPKSNISDIKKYIDNYNKITSETAEKHGIYWLGYGIQPVSTYRSINIIPKKRYEFMTKYLPTVAKRPLVMMRETSGIQASFDYSSERDAMRKFSTALKLSPIISAAFSNSPVRNGRLTKFKSNRSQSWLETDNDRCGLVSSKAFKSSEFSFESYAEILLDVPMIFIERNTDDLPNSKTAIKVENLTFRQFMQKGYNGYFATKDDWSLHLSLYFPDVRFKNYVEIRNHDNQKSEYICAVPSFWKGIIYNEDAMDAVDELLKNFTYFDFEYLRRKTPQYGLDMKIKNLSLKEMAKEIIQISYDSLKSYGENEEILLEPFKSLVDKGLTPADVIIKKWENEWSGNISKLVEFSRLT